jgi:hypothetical protein
MKIGHLHDFEARERFGQGWYGNGQTVDFEPGRLDANRVRPMRPIAPNPIRQFTLASRPLNSQQTQDFFKDHREAIRRTL